MTHSLHMRAERLSDFAILHDLHIRAFDNHSAEAVLVALLRTRQQYDPQLSLIAEIDGVIVGHALFNPMSIYFDGQVVPIVNLAPLAVHPDYQKQGIGGHLMQAGHAIAQDKGYDCSILLGHPDYYPRYGYHLGAYGVSDLTIETDTLPSLDFTTRTPLSNDLSALAQLHHENEHQVNLSTIPENTLAEWLSAHPSVPCTVYHYQDELVGYTRGTTDTVRLFIAKPDFAPAIAKHLAGDATTITLPLHPQSLCASVFERVPDVKTWQAAMIHPFSDDAIVQGYLRHVADGGLIGRVIWSSVFDIA